MSSEKTESVIGIDALQIDRLEFAIKRLKEAMPAVKDADEAITRIETDAQNLVARYALSLKMGKVDNDALKSFFRQPYPRLEPAVNPDGKAIAGTWRLTVPRFIPLHVGYLETQDEAWNYFRINRYMDWFGELPDFIKKRIGWKEPPELKLEGEELIGSPEAIEQAWKEFKPLLKGREGNKLFVNPENAYELIVGLLKKGVKPFADKPVDPTDIIERKCDYVLRDYQQEIWKLLQRKSSIGVFIPPSTGKTVLGAFCASHLKPPHIIVVPTLTLKEQWEDRIGSHTDLKIGDEIVIETYYSAIKKYSGKQFVLKVYDEVHHLPAKHFIKLSWIKAKYTIGLSATPYREDNKGRDIGGEEMIFALTGEPTGLPWQAFRDLRLIKSPICHIWVEKNEDAKLRRLNTLLQEPKKTIIFSDSLELGKSVAARYGIPFVYGSSTERLKTLTEAQTVVVSRVGDEGISLPDIERVIEISWLFGSRRQELQRFTRLLHGHESKTQGEAHAITTWAQWHHDKKRFFSILEKGFKVELHMEGISEKVIERETQQPTARRQRPRVTPEKKESSEAIQPQAPLTPSNPLLSSKGVQNALSLMKGMERSVFEFLIANDTSWITDEKLAFHLGLTGGVRSLQANVRFGWMQGKGWIERQKIEGKMASRTKFREIMA